jgi:hypothetical protein
MPPRQEAATPEWSAQRDAAPPVQAVMYRGRRSWRLVVEAAGATSIACRCDVYSVAGDYDLSEPEKGATCRKCLT